MLTPDGRSVLAGWVAAQLVGAELVISDGTTEARAPLSEPPLLDGPVVTLRAVFGEQEANFEWRQRGVVAGGELVDVDEGDFGRKAAGAVWTLEVPIELGVAS
jgi:hypothetical protein